MGRVVHDQVGCVVLQVKVEDANDVWMHQVAQKPGRGEAILTAECTGPGMQDFDSHAGIEIDMLSQVDIGKDSRAEPVQETVVPQALSHTVHALVHNRRFLLLRHAHEFIKQGVFVTNIGDILYFFTLTR